MNAKNFRLGNYYLENGILKTITPNVIEQLFESEDRKWFEPIHITEEILLKFGLKKREQAISDKWYIGDNPITHDWLFDITWIHGQPNPFYRNGFHEIKYVHQLQNLFFILSCGEEIVFSTEP